MSTTRAPKAPPSHMAKGRTSIWATVWAVVIQAPSSKPACTPPRMSLSPKVENRPLSVERKVPSRTASSPNQGMGCSGGAAGEAGAEEAAGALMACRRGR